MTSRPRRQSRASSMWPAASTPSSARPRSYWGSLRLTLRGTLRLLPGASGRRSGRGRRDGAGLAGRRVPGRRRRPPVRVGGRDDRAPPSWLV